MKTIFDYQATPYEVTLITGAAMTKEHYLRSERDAKQRQKDLFRLMVIRREKKKAWDFLENMDPHDAKELEKNELSFI